MDNHRAALRLLAFILFALGITLPLLWLPTPVVHAATITVTTLVDEDVANGFCSLREAIVAANTNAAYNGCGAGTVGMDTITFGVTGTIVLSSTLSEMNPISESLTIQGPVGGITISGNNAMRVLTAYAWNLSDPGPTVNLTDLTIANGNYNGGAGGLFAYNATVNITNTTFIGNSAPGNSAGAIFSNGGILNVTKSTFYNNSAFDGGAIFSQLTAVTLTQSTFNGNIASDAGGAVYNTATSGFGLVIINSTFYSNTAGSGGAIVNQNTTKLINSTLSNNTGIMNTGAITIPNGTVSLYNTIIANSVSGQNCGGGGALFDNGNNLQFGGTVANSCGVSIPTADPKLAAFGNYGGTTKTMPLLPGSPAIDGGNDTVCTTAYPLGANNVDQRGTLRPQGAHCDIGATESAYLFLPLILK